MKNVLTNMSFQLGLTKLSAFTDTKKALDEGDFEGVVSGILDSELARTQTPARAKRLADRVASIGSAPKKEKFPFSFQEAFDLAYRDGLVERLALLRSPQSQIDKWADMLTKTRNEKELQATQETEETAAPAAKPKPKLQKLEQGLFEDEAGKKFFVDEESKMFELDENNQPKVVIDPSQFDLSKVQDNSTASPEEEIF
jgi:hypothetical protein